MTKTEFKKTVAENNLLHTYGNGRKRLLAIFWDWHTAKNKEDGHGYKYMIVGDEGIPKSMIVDIAYDICIKKEYVISICGDENIGKRCFTAEDKDGRIFWIRIEIAINDMGRFKCPLSARI